MRDTDHRWRVTEGERCVVLSDDAKRCRRPAKVASYYHGDGEIGYPKVSWVRVALCEQHAALAPFNFR